MAGLRRIAGPPGVTPDSDGLGPSHSWHPSTLAALYARHLGRDERKLFLVFREMAILCLFLQIMSGLILAAI